MKWLNFDEFEFEEYIKEILYQCDVEDEVDVLCIKMNNCIEKVQNEKIEELVEE